MKLKKGDAIKVTGGKDKGKTGKIEKVFPRIGKVLVPGVNMYKRHLKPRDPRKPAGILDIVKPLSVGNVALVCPKCKQQTRAGYIMEGNEKVRICRKCKQKI